MLRSTRNEFFIGFTLSVILSLFANFALLIRRYDLMMDSKLPGSSYAIEKYELWFSVLWFFFFSFVLFVLYRWTYRWGDKVFQHKEVKTIGLAMGSIFIVALGLYRAYPVINTAIMGKVCNVSVLHDCAERSIMITEVSGKTLDTVSGSVLEPDKVRVGVNTVFSTAYSNPLLIEHIFVLLTIMLSMLLLHLLDKKQEMKLEYEKIKVEKLQNSYNALMGQINPHFFFNSLNGLNALIQSGEKQQTLAYLDELSNVFRYILQSNKKELVTLAEELQFVKAYTYLLSVRYEGKLFFSIQADTPYLLWYLPILSVLPLIENAVKHNVISKQYPLQIDIYTTHEDKLIISNKIHPKSEDSKGSGIGLKNLWGRYRMLTGKDIQISNRKEYFKVTLPLLNKPIHS